MFKNKFFINLFIVFFFILSVILSIFYLSKYDAYQLDGITHIMLKEETGAHWSKAAIILEQIKNGTSFFTAGGELFTKPLPQRLVAVYSYLTGFNIIDNWENFKFALGGKFLFLFTQSFLYYISVFLFYNQIKNLINQKICFFIIFFLCAEPTILQYHSSFWTESFYFSIQLLLLTTLLIQNEKNSKYIIIGLLLGLLFLQRSAGMFYVIIIIIYLLLDKKDNKLKKITLVLFPYLAICLILGLHNYKRAGIFYVMPTEGKYGMYKYFAKEILVEAKNSSLIEVHKSEVRDSLIWIDNNLPQLNSKDYEHKNKAYSIGRIIKNEKDKMKYWKYLNQRAFEILINNPIITIKKTIKGFIHFSILNPFFVYFDYEFFKDYSSAIIGDFNFSEKHRQLIPARIIYSFFIYIVCLIGLFQIYKKNSKFTLLLLFSIMYYYIILGWYGKTRLFTPNLIYLSIFFGYGLDIIFKKLRIYK